MVSHKCMYHCMIIVGDVEARKRVPPKRMRYRMTDESHYCPMSVHESFLAAAAASEARFE